jgi:hypothetical protein|tara:strand:+ start:679 stop:897 length:219 start_codon:yes stop_codon:yes gene_type:complete
MNEQRTLSPGNLVRINRAAIGIPAGRIALVLRKVKKRGNADYEIWELQLMGGERRAYVKYLGVDLEVISESR